MSTAVKARRMGLNAIELNAGVLFGKTSLSKNEALRKQMANVTICA